MHLNTWLGKMKMRLQTMATRGLYRTPLYRPVLYMHRRHVLKHWSAADERRARFLRQFTAPGDKVFDVGANMGQSSKLYLHLGATVVAFEPQTLCAEFLERVYKADPRVTVVQKALGGEAATGILKRGMNHGTSSLAVGWLEAMQRSGRFRHHRWDASEEVRIMTLDAAIETFGVPRFIKIDVEGYEDKVLSGLSRAVPCLSFEVTPEHLDCAWRCMDRLDKIGMKRFQLVLGEGTEFCFNEWLPCTAAKARLGGDLPAGAFGEVFANQGL